MHDAEIKNSDNSPMLIVDDVKMRRAMIGEIHLDNDSIKPANRRHHLMLSFSLLIVNFVVAPTIAPPIPSSC